MQSISLNNYNAGAATTVGGGVAGVIRRHTEYGITNNEWVCINDVSLSVYLDSLGIEVGGWHGGNFQRSAMLKYMGVRGDFYLRSKVNRHLYVGGGDKYNRDPWNREFPIFPGSNKLSEFGASGYKMTLYDYDCFHSSLWGDADNVLNVYVLSTSVCGNRVYCVDVLN